MSARRRVAIVGAGIGREHLRGYLAVSDRFEVATLCDIDTDRARTVLAEEAPHGGIGVEGELERVLEDRAIDLVDICLPPHLHAEAATAAMRAGKHVVCEKPLVPSLAEADALLAVAGETGRMLVPVFQYRYGPATAKLRALIEAGLAGRPQVASLETHWDRRADYYAVPWRGTWAGENGGAVLGHAIHNHDLLRVFMGPVASVLAHVATRVNAIEVEDCAAIAFRMENGSLATSSITLGAATDTTRLRLCFEHLSVESGASPYRPAEDEWRFVARDAAMQAEVDAVVAGVGVVRSGFAGFFEAVADALDGKGGSEVTAEDGRASIELVAAIYQSARGGNSVALPLDGRSSLYKGWAPVC